MCDFPAGALGSLVSGRWIGCAKLPLGENGFVHGALKWIGISSKSAMTLTRLVARKMIEMNELVISNYKKHH